MEQDPIVIGTVQTEFFVFTVFCFFLSGKDWDWKNLLHDF